MNEVKLEKQAKEVVYCVIDENIKGAAVTLIELIRDVVEFDSKGIETDAKSVADKVDFPEMKDGEWRCKCPGDPRFDTSINPKFFSYCSKCETARPKQIELAVDCVGFKAGSIVDLNPKRFTAPEPLPVGAKVRVLEIGSNFDHRFETETHVGGHACEVGSVVRVGDDVGELRGGNCYHVRGPNDECTWVRTVELVEEPAQPVESIDVPSAARVRRAVVDFLDIVEPVESEPSGNPSACQCDEMYLRRGLHHHDCVEADVNSLRFKLRVVTEEKARLTRERDAERDSLSARVKELEDKLALSHENHVKELDRRDYLASLP